jgi:uncharacterized repeat protein (TIGR03943 family)
VVKEKIKRSVIILTTCLPAFIYVIWLDAYYWLLEGGRYKAFIQPKLWPLLILALILLLMFVAAFISQFSLRSSSGIQLDTWIKALILIVPVLFLWTIYGQSLGTDAFAKRALNPDQIALRSDLNRLTLSSVKSADEVISLLDLIADAEKYHGKKVTTEGIVYRSAETGKNTFKVFRFAVVCCAADALPLAVVVKSSSTSRLSNDAWVRVEGFFNLEIINDQQLISIAADRVRVIPTPPLEKRYIYF